MISKFVYCHRLVRLGLHFQKINIFEPVAIHMEKVSTWFICYNLQTYVRRKKNINVIKKFTDRILRRQLRGMSDQNRENASVPSESGDLPWSKKKHM